MSWRHVFNADLSDMDLENAARAAYQAGYKFLCHDRTVYFVCPSPEYGKYQALPTGLVEEDLR